MVGVFRRSLSFPNKTPNRPSHNKPHISHHIRSISLPCRSHPLISHIKDDINHLTTTLVCSTSTNSNSLPQPQTYPNICNALNRLKDIHDTLQHVLHLPQTQDSLCHHPLVIEKLLEDFLRFVDVYGMFQTSILAFEEELSAVQMAIRKKDNTKVVLYVNAKKKMIKQMKKLVSCIRCVTRHGKLQVPVVSIGDAELMGIIEDVISVTVSVSVALFDGIATSFAARKLRWTEIVKLSGRNKRVNKEQEGIEELKEQDDEVESFLGNLKKKGVEEVRSVLKRMRDLEGCICGIESVSEKVFRALINSRVALLNILSQ